MAEIIWGLNFASHQRVFLHAFCFFQHGPPPSNVVRSVVAHSPYKIVSSSITALKRNPSALTDCFVCKLIYLARARGWCVLLWSYQNASFISELIYILRAQANLTTRKADIFASLSLSTVRSKLWCASPASCIRKVSALTTSLQSTIIILLTFIVLPFAWREWKRRRRWVNSPAFKWNRPACRVEQYPCLFFSPVAMDTC